MYTIAFENRLKEIATEAAEIVKVDRSQAETFVKEELGKMFFDGDASKIYWYNTEWMKMLKIVPGLQRPKKDC